MGGGGFLSRALVALAALSAVGAARAVGPAPVPFVLTPLRFAEPGGSQAFSLYVPQGWTFEGGVQPAGAAFTVSSTDGRCALRCYPPEQFVDPSLAPGGSADVYPPGSRYQGAAVSPSLPPELFLSNHVVPRWRGLAPEVWRVVEQRPLPEVARRFQGEAEAFDRVARASGVTAAAQFTSAAGLTVEYPLGGVPTRESFVAVLDYVRSPGTTVFWPRWCFSLRAPAAEFDAWAPRLLAAACSFELEPLWTVERLRSTHAAWRAVADVDACCARLAAELPPRRARSMAQLHREFFAGLGPFACFALPEGRSVALPSGGAWYRDGGTGALAEGASGRKPAAPGAWEALRVVTE